MTRKTARHRARWGIMTAIAVALGITVPLAGTPGSAEAATDGFIQPVSGYVTSIVGSGCDSSRPNHAGVDIATGSGNSIIASAAGKVTTRRLTTGNTGYGNYVIVTHAGGYTTLYAHMRDAPPVSEGQTVAQGQQLGVVGSTGNSTGNHLHFEIKRNGVNITNQGFSCDTNVTRGNKIPMSTPGLTAGAKFDVNSDGKADILAVSTTGTLTAYLGNGSGGLTAKTIGTGWGTTKSIIHGDYNGDGDGDFMAIRTDGTLWFYRGNGASTFASTQVGGGWNAFSLVTGGADFNADGRADLVARASDGSLKLYKGNGAGSFPTTSQIGTGWGSMNALVAGDFTGDGRGDIIARNTSGNLFLYPGDGTGIGAGTQIGNGWSTMNAITGGADYNSDGKADIISRGADGKLWLYTGKGAAGLNTGVEIGHGWQTHRLIS